MHRIATIALIGCLLISVPAMASEHSTTLASRGLVEFHAGHYAEALKLFEQAVAADPEDVSARYYRAAARARVGDTDGAIADLRVVLAAQPNLDQAALDLGVALIENKDYAAALPWLQQARGASDLEARASLFLGLAHLRLGDLDKARENFERARKDPKHRTAARYYEGVVAYEEGNWTQAREHFAYVARTSPDSPVGREAGKFLAKLAGGTRNRYQVYGSVGWGYDSNVILAPSGEAGAAAQNALNVSQEGDGFATFTVGGTAVPWQAADAHLSVGYDFYQSLHFELSEFDLQDHGFSVQLAGEIEPVRVGVLSRYDYYLLDAHSFLQEATALPWVTVSMGRIGRTELYYRMRRRDFKQQTYSVRDAFNHAVGARQYFYFGTPKRYLSVGYQFDREDPVISERLVTEGVFTRTDASSFAYDGNEVNANVGAELPMAINAELSYAYRNERYTRASATFTPSGTRRSDNEHLVTVVARKQLRAHLAMIAAYLFDHNSSNDPRFEYDRHIVSLTLEVRY